ncbi:hypothetical protein [Actinoplanes sp. NPDC089786]|uniref:hypothetical protein n=1 Tax=Actinoplanes sp. NPDC089786 TaxID=3155185 RepID=UPI003429E8DD
MNAKTSTIDGTWAITFAIPRGERSLLLTVATDGETAAGTHDGVPILDGRVVGNELTYTARLTQPFAIEISARATVTGDTMTGEAQAPRGSVTFSATRTA